jgi:hypothetical protein
MTANAGYHAYATGDVLTAAQVQYNLQNQTVMYFATSAARTTALSGVTVEGMVTYIPANGIEYYNGTAWIGVTSNASNVPNLSNPVLNSAFQVWQRGTSIAVAASSKTYTADRWWGARGGSVAGSTVSRQSTNDTTNLPFIQYCARVQRDSGNTSVQYITLSSDFETINSIPFAGKSVTFSFYARAGANFSAASNALSLSFVTGTGTDQSLSTGYTGQTTAISGTATLTTTWQRFSYTGTISSTATQIGLQPYYTPVGTAGANDYFEITGIQLELGSVATPFDTYATTYQGELAACQRYYYRQTVTAANQAFGMAQAYSTTNAYGAIPFPVAMRTPPTALEQSGTAGDYRITTANFGAVNCSSVPAHNIATTWQGTVVFAAASGLVAGNGSSLQSTATNAYLGWSAEL